MHVSHVLASCWVPGPNVRNAKDNLLLVLPGFATDFLGLLIIFPPTRKLIFKKVSNKQKANNKNQDFINGEFEDIEDKDDRKL